MGEDNSEWLMFTLAPSPQWVVSAHENQHKHTHSSFPNTVMPHIPSYPVDEDILGQLCVGVYDSHEDIETFPSVHLIHHFIQTSICTAQSQIQYMLTASYEYSSAQSRERGNTPPVSTTFKALVFPS